MLCPASFQSDLDIRFNVDGSAEHTIEIIQVNRFQPRQLRQQPGGNTVLLNTDIAGYPGVFVLPAARGMEATGGAVLALVRFGGITHGNYMDQRFIWIDGATELLLDRTSPNPNERTWRFTFELPNNATLLTPGAYMLFILDQLGVPSVGAVVAIDILGIAR